MFVFVTVREFAGAVIVFVKVVVLMTVLVIGPGVIVVTGVEVDF